MSRLIHSHPLRSSLSTKSNITNIFLQLPPSFRSFHASPRPQFIEASVSAAHSIFEGLHSITSLPWAYTIPLAAIAIRTSIVLPITIYSRYNAQKQASLTPLISAWQHPLRKETMSEVGHLGPIVAQSTLLKKTRRKSKEIYKRYSCEVWKNILPPLVQIPVWLTAIEALRQMCGKEAGLMGMAAGLFRGDELTTSYTILQTGLSVEPSFVEPSFATEGALWFPNLLVADPQMILPFMLSGAILLNLSKSTGTAVWQKRMMRALGIVGLAIGPLTLQVPSAMLIYWICSSLSAYVQAAVLERLMPIKPPVVPCKSRKPKGMPEQDSEKF